MHVFGEFVVVVDPRNPLDLGYWLRMLGRELDFPRQHARPKDCHYRKRNDPTQAGGDCSWPTGVKSHAEIIAFLGWQSHQTSEVLIWQPILQLRCILPWVFSRRNKRQSATGGYLPKPRPERRSPRPARS